MSSALQDLERRLADATEGSRELDADILITVHGWRRGNSDDLDGFLLAPGSMEWVEDYPRPTSSLDAALTLVPEGHYWTLDSVGVAYVHKAGVKAVHHYGEHRDDCLPVALCLAAIRARIAMQKDSP